jgi:2-oxo-4-hydroxy-4-carboxy-5-ureidoimidazoline decarboxylase
MPFYRNRSKVTAKCSRGGDTTDQVEDRDLPAIYLQLIILTMNLSSLNQLDQTAFTEALADIFEHSPWIPKETWAARPFDSIEDLHGKLCKTLDASDTPHKLDLIRAHPDLAGKLAISGELTDFSTTEQASAQLDKLTAEQFERMSGLNQQYKDKFGFPFIICVKEHTQNSIFENFEERVNNDADAEQEAALFQIKRIAWHRLNDLIQ